VGGAMSCLSCGSNYQTEFATEMIIHFSGLENLDNPGVWAFPKHLVCLDCGFSRFTLPEAVLALLAKGTRTNESAALRESADDVAPRPVVARWAVA
jgi:hypothetical protein